MAAGVVSAALVGLDLEAVAWSWGPDQAILYALGVGAEPEDALPFVYEGYGPLVLPTFATVPTGLAFLSTVQQLGLDVDSVLHAEQSLRIFRTLPPSGHVSVKRRVAAVWDKGAGAIIVIDEDDDSDEPLFSARSSWWVSGAGGHGGERGPGRAPPALPEESADVLSWRRVIPANQAALFRLSGDRNPLHVDPKVARRAGFPGTFVHGLCTYGIVGGALVSGLCAGDPSRLKEMHARFVAPVCPHDELTIEAWRTGSDAVGFRALVDGRTVLTEGRAGIAG